MFGFIITIVVFIILQVMGAHIIGKMLVNAQRIEEYHLNGDEVLKRLMMKRNKHLAFFLLVNWTISLILVFGIANDILEMLR